MDGLIRTNHAQTLYITVRDGCIILPVENPTETSIQRQNKVGRMVNEEHYNQLNAAVLNVELRDNADYGKQWYIRLFAIDAMEYYTLQLPESSSNTWSLLNRLLNVEPEETISIRPYCFTPSGETKEFKGCVVRRMDNTKVEPYATRDNPRDCPELTQVEFKGKMQYDDSARTNWLSAKFTEKFKAQAAVQAEPQVAATPVIPAAPAAEECVDDLPF
jgi:hypothetical protein